MEHEFWHERWREGRIGFHQPRVNRHLERFWPDFGLADGSSVFVPLSGKSLDMVWLAGRGHRVIANELSEIAIDEFFAGIDLIPDVEVTGGFRIKRGGPYEIWCGDYFALPNEVTASVAAIYDRASLIALPPEMRGQYVRKLNTLNRAKAPTLLLTLEYDQDQVPGPPFSVLRDEVGALFAPTHRITEKLRGETDRIPPKFTEHGLKVVTEVVYRLDAT